MLKSQSSIIHLSTYHIIINLVNNPDDLYYLGIVVKDSGNALVVDIGKWRFKKHGFIDGAIFSQVRNDCVDKGDLIGSKVSCLNKIGKQLLCHNRIEPQKAADKFSQWQIAIFLAVIFF